MGRAREPRVQACPGAPCAWGGGAEAQRPLLIPARVSVMRDRKAPWAMGFDCLALARCLINDWALAVAVTIAVLNSLLFASQSVRSRLV